MDKYKTPEASRRLASVMLASGALGRPMLGTPGIPAVSPNAFGDFIQTPGTPTFDAVQAYSVVRMTLSMYQRALAIGGVAAVLPWQWNSSANTDPLAVFPHGLPDTMNAFTISASTKLPLNWFSLLSQN